jgi:hypothetical protein
VAVFARHGVPAPTAARIVDEVSNHGEGTSSRDRMEFVFAGAARLYGFTDVAPAGKRVAPLLDKYLRSVGDYAEHLGRLRRSTPSGTNELLARALQPTCFAEARGLDKGSPEYAREAATCILRDTRVPIARRVERAERLFERPDFLAFLPAIDSLVAARTPESLDPAALASIERIGKNRRARSEILALAGELETPALRLEIVRVARALGWLSAEEAIPFQRQIAIRLLHPPLWGESRDLLCGMGRETLDRLDVRADELSAEVYANEFGIQALGCLRPGDGEIRERLARSLSDSREWIANLTAVALKGMPPPRPSDVSALAKHIDVADHASAMVR